MRRRVIALAGALGALAAFAAPAQASVSVTTPTDEVANNSACSLREAIGLVNAGITSSPEGCTEAGANPTTINVPAGDYKLTRFGAANDDNGTGDLDVKTSMTIQGAGAGSTFIDGDQAAAGTSSDRVFDVFNNAGVDINGVTIENGRAPNPPASANGGGILVASDSSVSLDDDVVSGNFAGGASGGAAGSGGGIYSAGTLTVSRTTIGHNQAGAALVGSTTGGSGGGIASIGGHLTVNTSVLDANQAGAGAPFTTGGFTGGSGGGVFASGNVGISNSTIAANQAGVGGAAPGGIGGGGGSGGGLYFFAAAGALHALTVSGNAAGAGGFGAPPGSSGAGGGVLIGSGALIDSSASIFASNGLGGNCGGTVTDFGHNLAFGDASCPAGFAVGDPKLGQLANNGGPTQTMAIGSTSAARDKIPSGDPTCLATDQRGVTRPQGAGCDIGAFELGRYKLSVFKSGTGTGVVTSTPAAINCGNACSTTLDEGTTITLKATPNPGSTFAGWTGACSGTATCTLKIGAATTAVANFTAPPNTKITKAKVNRKKDSATFRFKAIGATATGFQCALVKSKHQKPRFKPCTSPERYRHLKPHRYAFGVRAVGPGGVDPTVAGKKFRIK